VPSLGKRSVEERRINQVGGCRLKEVAENG
jgi:hypothetical protein